ncbi:MAG: hypothetical protein Q8L64_06150 [bacterium]|nr:hypothetical protein [bacterium]
MSKLWRPFTRLVSWRREFGVWFSVFAVGHGYVIWERWAQGDVMRLFGFEYLEQVGGYILSRPEVGIMNLMGLMLLPMIILLTITSFDRAVSFLGISSWKWLHNSLAHVIFYVIVLRGILYLFFFFELSYPRMAVYPPVWFLYPFIGMALLVVLLQSVAFIKIVLRQRAATSRRGFNIQSITVCFLGVLFILPIALPGGMILYLESRSVDVPPVSAQVSKKYSQSFYMVINSGNQDIHLWARDLDSKPYFRETIEVGGLPISHKIYKFSERAIYVAQLDESKRLAWSKSENIEPESIGISGLAGGPGVWALQYDKGKHQITVDGKALAVTIHGVDEVIEDEVFKLPNFQNSVSPSQQLMNQ